MIHIAVCDDELKIGGEIEQTVRTLLGELDVKHELDVYTSGAELCRNMKTGAYYDLIFLDIEFAGHEINGVEVGRQIREVHHNHMVSIVYISWEKKYALELFEIQPLNFLVKPVKQEKLEEVVIKYLKIAKLWKTTFTYKVGHDTYKAQIKDIVYLESYNRKLILHLVDGRKVEFYGSIKEAYQEQLKKCDFLYIHNAYVVNFDYIAALKFDQAILVDSVTPLPISKHRRSEVKEAYYAIMDRRGV